MGTQISKTGQTYKEKEPDQGSLPSTPILTPKNRNLSELDPRSPSADIVRTPIQLSNGKNLNQTPIIGEINTSFEVHTDEENTFENPAVFFDPRSPSVDFIRTPIVIEKSGVKLRNKNLDNVKKLTLEFSPVKKNNTENGTLEKQIKPRLLESSPIVKKTEVEKRKSFVGLLETNLDYVETDLDKVKQKIENKNKSTENLDSVPEENHESPICEVKNEIEDKIQKLNQIDAEIKEVIEVTVDPTIEQDKSKIEVIIEQELINTPKKKLQKPSELENPVTEFDKKITNLIYEDQTVQISSPKQKLKDNNRTPLGDRNRNQTIAQKSTSKLRVHDKPRNEYNVSKIPVFKDKKSKIQCENTPPALKKPESRIKKSQWDTADKTLII